MTHSIAVSHSGLPGFAHRILFWIQVQLFIPWYISEKAAMPHEVGMRHGFSSRTARSTYMPPWTKRRQYRAKSHLYEYGRNVSKARNTAGRNESPMNVRSCSPLQS